MWRVIPLLALFSTAFLWCHVEASHFRGGIITWRPLSHPDTTNVLPMIEISYRMAWRRSSGSGHLCTDESVASRTVLAGEGSLKCSCSGLSQTLSYICTDFSEDEDWSTGVNSAQYQPDVTTFEVWFFGSAWISLHNGGGNWDLGATVDLTVREDTGRINSSPTTATLPIVRFQRGCNNVIKVPVSDADGDDVRCFWATRRCGGICNPLPGAVMNEEACELVWNVEDTALLGLYGVAIEIQDFATKTSTEALSTIPLQFLVELTPGQRSDCASQPMFIPPTHVSASCIGVPENTTYHGTIVVRTGSPDVSLTGLETVSPQGAHYSEVSPYPGGLETDYYVEATWTPDTVGVVDILCFIARDSERSSSEQLCISLVTGTTPPQPIASSLKPINGSLVLHIDLRIQLQFDQDIVRPTRPAFINVYSETDTLVYQRDAQAAQQVGYLEGNVIEFAIPGSVLTNLISYYILMDPGVAKTTTFCGVESSAVTKRDYWTFTVVDCPDGWQRYNNFSCYQFIDSALNWVSARNYCTENSLHGYGHLATIQDQMENDFITRVLLEGRKRRAWIGLGDMDEEGVFKWYAYGKEPYESEFAPWKRGEPNNGLGDEDCVEINRGRLGEWNDCKCRKPLPFICEMELSYLVDSAKGSNADEP